MTTAVKEKKPFLPQRRTQPSNGAVAVRGGMPARVSSAPVNLAIGGEPRVHLLPAETIERKKLKALKRRLMGWGVASVVLVIAGYGVATFALTSAQNELSNDRTETSLLLTQQAKYGSVTKVNSDISAIKAAQVSTTTQEILWAPFVQSLQATLPADAVLSSVNAQIDVPTGSTTTQSSGPDTTPLQGPRIATVLLNVTMNQSEIPGWLDRLPSLKGYVDDEPGSLLQAGANIDSVSVTLHLNSQAVSGRFTTKGGTSNE